MSPQPFLPDDPFVRRSELLPLYILLNEKANKRDLTGRSYWWALPGINSPAAYDLITNGQPLVKDEVPDNGDILLGMFAFISDDGSGFAAFTTGQAGTDVNRKLTTVAGKVVLETISSNLAGYTVYLHLAKQ